MKKILLTLAVVLPLVANVASANSGDRATCKANGGTWSKGQCITTSVGGKHRLSVDGQHLEGTEVR